MPFRLPFKFTEFDYTQFPKDEKTGYYQVPVDYLQTLFNRIEEAINNMFKTIIKSIQPYEWIGNQATITIQELEENDIVWISPTVGEFNDWTYYEIKAVDMGAGYITLACREVPETEIKVLIIIKKDNL